ncbi:similar to Saccharomyces cerevisiae YOR329C SCD5 Protein required for normal actin organization and endocytosis [Maudiozyma saulgeensis]|uniref:Similar to Saccharomyces cerevisiae YOR329C SCD5 Protein required for normal actin organization and endocytosis n=1 Tax=Maudiozyma saulgeensis TaxID=1789683 RepID=A0A1X7R5M6_9SACH|nr:similar to Saccharomyces cerevisiae YOR329C SCD5 Protein required for normal actin organization and endocytosis [Kazachstania saulgeensis]
MSFDWLNVPGLNIENTGTDSKQNEPVVPPSVSFDFGLPPPIHDAGTMTRDSRSISDTALDMEVSNSYNNANNSSNAFLNVNPPQHAASNNDITTIQEHKELTQYKETADDLKVPLSLSQNQLTHEEIRTYLRWYKYILARSHTKLVRLQDVFRFLGNFTINEELKARIMAIFRSCKSALNIGQFFAVLRLISRAMIEGVLPYRRMILEKAPIPKPRPILSTQGNGEIYEEVEEDEDNKGDTTSKGNGSVDFDSFTSLLLTGKTIRKRVRRKILNAAFRNKRVRFSESITFQDPPTDKAHNHDTQHNNTPDANNGLEEPIPQGPLDLSLPMDQLLKQMATRKHNNTALVSKLPSEQQETEEEREELRDMQDSLSHFKQIQTVDAVTGLGTQLPVENTNGRNVPNMMGVSSTPLQPLKPTATGSANHFMRQEVNQGFSAPSTNDTNGVLTPLKPTATGSANHFMRQEMNQGYITSQNTEPNDSLQPLKPTATGSANYLVRSHFETNENIAPTQQVQPSFNQNSIPTTAIPALSPQHTTEIQPLKPTATGSANYLMKQQFATPMTAPHVNNPAQSNQNMPAAGTNGSVPRFQATAPNDQFMNFPQQQQQQQPNIQYQNSGTSNGSISQQNTYSNNNVSQSAENALPQLHPQNTYPQAHVTGNNQNIQNISHQQQQQQQFGSSNLLNPGANAASNYFQSLLTGSHSPSPNASHIQVSNTGNNGLGMHPQGNQQMYSGTSLQPPTNNNSNDSTGYGQYQNGQPAIYQNQQVQQQQNQSNNPHSYYPGQIQSPPPGSYNSTSQHPMQNTMQTSNQTHLNVPQYSYSGQQNHSSQPNPNILGDYQAMQNQVNSLQQSYNRR